MNTTCVIGNLGGDCTTRGVNGKVVINFVIGDTNRYKKDADTLWWKCEYWANSDAVAQYLKKGTRVAVSGQVEADNYIGRTGEKVYQQKLRVNDLELLGGANVPAEQGNTAKTPENAEKQPTSQPAPKQPMPEGVQNLAEVFGAKRDDLPF